MSCYRRMSFFQWELIIFKGKMWEYNKTISHIRKCKWTVLCCSVRESNGWIKVERETKWFSVCVCVYMCVCGSRISDGALHASVFPVTSRQCKRVSTCVMARPRAVPKCFSCKVPAVCVCVCVYVCLCVCACCSFPALTKVFEHWWIRKPFLCGFSWDL